MSASPLSGDDVGVTGLSAVAADTATFRVPDPDGRLAGARLIPEIPVMGQDFTRDDAGWTLVIARPPVNRMEYKLEFRYPDGGAETAVDPGNPRRAAGAFGEKSVLEFPEYQPPAWLTAPADAGVKEEFRAGRITGRLWSPSGATGEEPLLVVHDGPEYDAFASLTHYLAAGAPRVRALLLDPGDRNYNYSASTRYAVALAEAIPSAPVTIGMGTSLGALAMLHAHCAYPRLFDALFLQSGSFFSLRYDAHEGWFPHYQRIVRFVACARLNRPVPVSLTCGIPEENLDNNRAMTQRLRERGYPATLHEVPDAHNYTAWRDAFHPHLTRLLQQVCQ